MQFIAGERVDQAIARELFQDPTAALVMGVDVARHGDDQTVIRFRRGLDARGIPAVKFRIPDMMAVAGRVMELVNCYEPDACSSTAPASAGASSIACASSAARRCAASISAARPTAPTAARRRCATPTNGPRCGAT